ncbi:MAG: universal stress protein, partial [Planctomycetaceae bacterium]|nr:universal stress protein [Planctomycetaceae bacterium]
PVGAPGNGRGRRHILIPTHLAGYERSAVLLGLQLANASHARTTLLRVLPPQEQPSSMHWLDAIDSLYDRLDRRNGDPNGEQKLSLVDAVRAEILTYVQREVPAELLSEAAIQVEVRFGDLASEVARYADETQVDLIVLSSGPPGWGLGLRAGPRRLRQILQLAKQEVVMVRPETGARSVPAGRVDLSCGASLP